MTRLVPIFEHLQAHHERQSFDCGQPSLNTFLQRQARQNADRNIGVTHIAVSRAGDSKILAYYNLVTRTVTAATVPGNALPQGAVGVVLLGRLAVEITVQRQGLGSLCLLRAIAQVERAAREVGIYTLVVDAIDEDARNWYIEMNWGFLTLLDDPNHLYITLDTIRQIDGL